MEGGKRRNAMDSVKPQHSPNTPPTSIQPFNSTTSADIGGGDMTVGAEYLHQFNREESAEEGFEGEGEGEEDSESEKYCRQFENPQIEGPEAEEERPKLADGYYELEAVRRKRIRKGQEEYLIKWRDWPEAANTWEPLMNLLDCSDVIDAFEESLKSRKSRLTRKRNRKGGTHSQIKKKQEEASPAAATYKEPEHMVEITKDPTPLPQSNDLTAANDNGKTYVSTVDGVDESKKVNENDVIMVPATAEGRSEHSELDSKLCQLKGAMMNSEDNVDRLAVSSQEGQVITGDAFSSGQQMADGTEPAPTSRSTGAKKRKSGSVKRFKNDSVLNNMDDAQYTIGFGSYNMVEPKGIESPDKNTNSKSQLEDSIKHCTITRIIKPISYKASISNNIEDVLVFFEAERADGTKVTVDNKFLKSKFPVLLIEFYEKHLCCGSK